MLVAEARTLPKSDRPAEIQEGLAAAGSVGVSPNRLTLLRDGDGDGTAEVRETFVDNLNQPFGMALVGDDLYFKLGNLAFRQRDRDRARDCWRRAAELNPGHQLARSNLEILDVPA